MNELVSMLSVLFEEMTGYKYLDKDEQDNLEKLKLIFLSYIISKETSIKQMLINKTDDSRLYVKKLAGISVKLRVYYNGNYSFEVTKTSKKLGNKSDFRKLFGIDKGFVYFIKSEHGWKIGKTTTLKKRMRTFDVKLPFEHECYYYFETLTMSKDELMCHNHFKDFKINGEWFNVTKDQIKQLLSDKNIKIKRYRDFLNKLKQNIK